MRKSTLLVVSYIIVFPVVYILPYIAEASGFVDFPRWSFAGNGVAAFLGAGVLSLVLTPLNKRILAWRKSHGRDIEEEERYESDHGMIRLSPYDEHK